MKFIDLFSDSLKKYHFLCFLLLITFSCKDDPVKPPDNVDFSISVEDVSCIEAWISLKAVSGAELKLFRNDSLIKTLNIFPLDTIICDEGLLPNQPYTYKAEVLFNNKIYSKEAVSQTMDTTSHNFSFQSWTFGDIGSSVLYDAIIINEDNIWAVGEIMYADTGKNVYTTYNAIHWNGYEWTLHRFMFYTFCGQQHQNSYSASSVIAFSENELWIAMKGDQITRIENGIQKEIICMPYLVSINKMWGSSSNNLYLVGNNGFIAHYNGKNWIKIESGTNLNLNDIWGDYNEKTGEWEILSVGGNILQGLEHERLILKIDGSEIKELNTDGTYWPLRTIWFNSSHKYYIAGSGIYEKHFLNEKYWNNDIHNITTYAINNLCGISNNNIAATGGVGELVHFNGYDWYSHIGKTRLTGNYYGLDITENTIIAVGQNNSKAVITIGFKY